MYTSHQGKMVIQSNSDDLFGLEKKQIQHFIHTNIIINDTFSATADKKRKEKLIQYLSIIKQKELKGKTKDKIRKVNDTATFWFCFNNKLNNLKKLYRHKKIVINRVEIQWKTKKARYKKFLLQICMIVEIKLHHN